MLMQMVHVRGVGMAMGQCFVLMRVAMADTGRHRIRVRVLMVCVMHMGMIMFHARMGMFMYVAFGEMHPDAPSHQRAGGQ